MATGKQNDAFFSFLWDQTVITCIYHEQSSKDRAVIHTTTHITCRNSDSTHTHVPGKLHTSAALSGCPTLWPLWQPAKAAPTKVNKFTRVQSTSHSTPFTAHTTEHTMGHVYTNLLVLYSFHNILQPSLKLFTFLHCGEGIESVPG